MDPVSLSGLAISCVQVAIQTTSAIIQYANDTRNAKTHIKLLANEAASLQAILRVIEDKLKVSAADPQWILARTHVVRQFQTAYDDLAQMLQLDASGVPRRQSGARMVIETATWPFKKSEVYALLERITRIQQYANTFLLTDQVWVSHANLQPFLTTGLGFYSKASTENKSGVSMIDHCSHP